MQSTPMPPYTGGSAATPREEGRMLQFDQLARMEIGQNNFAVISARNDGKVALAQQSVTIVNNRPRHMFAKGAFEMAPEKLFVLRDLIDEAIRNLFDSPMLTDEALTGLREELERRYGATRE